MRSSIGIDPPYYARSTAAAKRKRVSATTASSTDRAAGVHLLASCLRPRRHSLISGWTIARSLGRGNRVIEWLTADGIIDATPTDDRDVWGPGYYRPGPQHRLAVAHPDHPYAIAFAQSRLGRLQVVIGRTVSGRSRESLDPRFARSAGTPL